MPTKTDRILSYLPGTFRTSPRPPILYPVADAFGNELLLGENSLSAVMMSHWVDFADKNASAVEDLKRSAALYGLTPRDDESVEEFREHLKRYVRTLLEGTATVQGILRVTAKVLGLHILDSNDELDGWWKRRPQELITVTSRGDDAASLLLGMSALKAQGSPALPALIKGTAAVDSIDLGSQPHLYLATDTLPAKDVSLPSGIAALDKVVDVINAAAGQTIARADGSHLVLSSVTLGPAGRVQVLDGVNDAAPQVLGLAPRVYHGSDASAATLTSTVDLSGGADLSTQRYLRLAIDGALFAEVDCADTASPLTSLDHIRDAINAALGATIASHDGHFLTLQSLSTGFGSIVALQRATAQDAAARIFGQGTALATGQKAQPARATGSRDLSGGVDLSQAANILLRIDSSPQMIDCAGTDPAHTQTIEIVNAINGAFKARVASPDGTAITIASRTTGPAAEVAFDPPPQGDATEIIFGIRTRTSHGSPETTARISGIPDLSQGVNLMARRYLSLAVDGGDATEIDLQVGAADPQKTTLQEMAATINQALGTSVASDDSKHLILTSPTPGLAGNLEVVPLETTERRHFVTRALITDEAAQTVLGFVHGEADGTPGTSARLVGDTDLSFGSDLREGRYLNMSVDGQAPVEFDCAGARPRATLLQEVVDKINAALKEKIAGSDGRHLILTAPSFGAVSRIDILPPRTRDALPKLLGVAPGTVRGQDATRVTFTGLVDLSNGIDLPANAAIKISMDGGTPKEVTVGEATPVHKSLSDIANAINQAVGAVISPVGGNRLVLNSSSRGADSKIELLVPVGPDVTPTVLGVSTPRSYSGDAAQPARVAGTQNLAGTFALTVSHFLRFSVDGSPAVEVDCASESADPVSATLDDVVKAINKALRQTVASANGNHLVLTSPTSGFSSRITLDPFSGGDARNVLLGSAGPSAQGKDASLATITGTKAIDGSLDLSKRRLLRLAINGALQDIDISGKFPSKTSFSEVVDAINKTMPGMASVTDDDRLRLVSPRTQTPSHLSILPLRFLEVVEYSPTSCSNPPLQLACGSKWYVFNPGAFPSDAEIDLLAPRGTVSPELVNLTLSQSLRLLTHLSAGEIAHIRSQGQHGLRVWITSPNGAGRIVPGTQVIAGPTGSQAIVPFEGSWRLPGNSRALQLNNPATPNIVIMRARHELEAGDIDVTVAETAPAALSVQTVTANGSLQRLCGRLRVVQNVILLVDAQEHPLARVRPGAGVNLASYQDQVVATSGPVYAATPPLQEARAVYQLFDVSVTFTPAKGTPANETFAGVTIGDEEDSHSLLMQLNGNTSSVAGSKLVKAANFEKASVLRLLEGRSDWLYLDCDDSRYNRAHFNQDSFPNGLGHECGVFNASHFAYAPPERVAAVFASSVQPPEPSAEITLRWTNYQPGTFAVNLPLDLPARFGGRFNLTRFATAATSPEVYAGAVTEPLSDPHFLTKLISSAPSNLVQAQVVPLVPLGWTAASMPFRRPQFLTLGSEREPARLYLTEEGLDGAIEFQAREPGDWGNQIAVTARQSGPAMYDVEISYQGARFENAREVVRGLAPPPSANELVQPSPIGVLQAKAAGVLAKVTRDGAGAPAQAGKT